MKILFVSAVFPYPLYSGGQIRIYNLIKELSKRHAISLFSFIRNEEERKYIDALSFCKRVEMVNRGHAWQPSYILRSIFGKYPLLLSTYANEEMRRKLTQILQNEPYDLIHIEPGYVWPSIPQHTIPSVVAEHNIEHTVYELYVRRFPIIPLRPFLYADVLKLLWWEKYIWKKAKNVIAVSEDDKEIINQTIDVTKISVVPNGVDISLFPYTPKKLGDHPVFLFVGNFLWMQNKDAVKQLSSTLWPRIMNIYPDATLRIVGKHMPENLRQNLSSGMVLLEHVEDIIDEYKKADIVLAPIRVGGGTQFKILEAMAAGIPVVTTSKGAEGLKVANGKELFIADDENGFASVISQLLTNQKLKNTVTRSARTCIETYYSWKIIARELERVWMKTYEASH